MEGRDGKLTQPWRPAFDLAFTIGFGSRVNLVMITSDKPTYRYLIVVHEAIASGCTVKRRSTRQCRCRLVSKQAAVASVVFIAFQTTLLDHLGSSSQCCCDGRIANVWQRLDENFLDFFLCEAVIEPGPHVDGEFMGLTHGNHNGHRN